MARPEQSRSQTRSLTLLFAAVVAASGLAGILCARPPVLPHAPTEPVPAPLPAETLTGPGPVARPQNVPFPMPPELEGVDLNQQNDGAVAAKSDGCLLCHTGQKDPHFKKTVHLGCIDCHGGCMPNVTPHMIEAAQATRQPGEYRSCPASPPSKNPEAWRNSANPVRSWTLLNFESPDYVRFVNPGDQRINHISCGTTNCHGKIVNQNRKSMMTHGCMLWGAALYNNGSVPYKVARHGEFYSMQGVPLRAQSVPPPDEFETKRGVIPFLDPLPRFEITQPGNILRIFERGGKIRPDVGIPNKDEDPGKPFLSRLSNRGLGCDVRTDPVFLGLQKTRLFNPTLNMIGTNEQPGDYRQSGCTACHVIYANDRSETHSGPYAKHGQRGMAAAVKDDFLKTDPDPTIPKNESGHPINHRFAPGNAIPTSQCMTCHVHPGTTVMNSYLGYMWWDEETDGELMYPAKQKHVTAEEFIRVVSANPDETAAKGNWSDPEFLANLTDLNTQTKHTQFADFHSHGWVFRAVFRHDRKGNLLDYNGNQVTDLSAANLKRGVDIVKELKKEYVDGGPEMSPEQRKAKAAHDRAGVPMHLVDVHVEKGMHCIDCHFTQDNHGNERLQQEVRAAIEIQCIDCHGTVTKRATLRTTGPAAYTSNPEARTGEKSGRDLASYRTPSGKPRFERIGDKIFQNSTVEQNLRWEVTQTMDTVDPKSSHYNKKAALAKTVHFEGNTLAWGAVPPTPAGDDSGCAHSNKQMTCITCHSSWNPSCFGCHLPQRANVKAPMLHNTGDVSRNLHTYDFQTLRDDVYMLARDGNATGNRINPSRSSCAVHVGSYNQNRESVYYQQQTISGEGFSGIAFSTNVPHTISGVGTTKNCTDCHLSEKNDNNAIMAQLLMHGTNYLNWIGKYAWMAAGEHGLFAVQVTERDEPQAVIGSYLHKLAYPDDYAKHLHNGRMLETSYEHPGKDIGDNVFHPFRKNEVLNLQLRGEYLYAACGEAGLRVYDVAFLDHKGFSERFNTAPVSPCGQRFQVDTAYATAVAAPATTAPDPTRAHYIENDEGRVAGMYAYLYVTDKYEGLVMVGAGTLLDGDPLNNFLKKDIVFNPKGILCGARAITIVGHYAYICADAGLVIVDIEDPKKCEVKTVIKEPVLKHPHAVACQFRYAYVADEEGIKVLDITDLAKPVGKSKIAIEDVHNLYLARTYAYLAAGKQGLVILDIENPEQPKIDQIFNAGGCINDLHDVKLGITYTSEFAYLADGKNGMRVLHLTNPDTPGNGGFSPRPTPELIATYKIEHGGHALAISKGVDRDRAVDESGNQLSVFGRVGARPLNLKEQQKMYLHDGKPWYVSDEPDWSGYQRSK